MHIITYFSDKVLEEAKNKSELNVLEPLMELECPFDDYRFVLLEQDDCIIGFGVQAETSGYSGGGWRDTDQAKHYTKTLNGFELHTLLSKLMVTLNPKLSLADSVNVSFKIKAHTYTKYEYHGDSTDFQVNYLPLSLIKELVGES